jgi:hypothetical protein
MISLTVFISSLLFTAILFFVIGRYAFFTKAGLGIATKMIVQPVKRMGINNMSKKDLHKAAGSRLKRVGETIITTKDVNKSVKGIAVWAGVKPTEVVISHIEKETWKLTLKNQPIERPV